ncbi:hypothetical protein AVEN_52896-1, partial [Araneus ventricosus]
LSWCLWNWSQLERKVWEEVREGGDSPCKLKVYVTSVEFSEGSHMPRGGPWSHVHKTSSPVILESEGSVALYMQQVCIE